MKQIMKWNNDLDRWEPLSASYSGLTDEEAKKELKQLRRWLEGYYALGWPATWDVRMTIALAQHMVGVLERLPWGRQCPTTVGVDWDGSVLLVYYEPKPATTAEEIINNAGTCIVIPMQSAFE